MKKDKLLSHAKQNRLRELDKNFGADGLPPPTYSCNLYTSLRLLDACKQPQQGSRLHPSTGATEFYPEQRCGKGRPNKGLALAPPAFALPASHLSLCLSHRLSRRVVCFSICRCMVLHSRSAVVALRMVADRVWRRHRSGAERCRIAALPIIAAADHRRCRSCGRRACTDTLLWERCRGRARQSSYLEEASTRSHDG